MSYLDRVFPELEKIVGKSGIHSKAMRAILKVYPTAKSISEVRIDHLKNLAETASHNRFPHYKIENIKAASKSSIGFHSSSLGLRIKQTIEMLETIEKQIDEINSSISSNPLVSGIPSFLGSRILWSNLGSKN